MACILLCSPAVRVHDSQAYTKLDVTKEHISPTLELREMLQRHTVQLQKGTDCFAGHKLLHQQSDVPVDGWSFECRVYAEVLMTALLLDL